jgi:hypothetical protein
MKTTLLILMFAAIPALAQEPSSKIQPADTITKTASLPISVSVGTGGGAPAPIIYPDPLPHVKLGLVARQYRAVHATAPKAKKVANDDAPIVANEQEKQ